jgi:hypothetical protein
VLPFTKRPARSESPELINTGDIEVVRSPESKRPAAFPKPATDRPRVFTRSASDDEMTTLLPRKGMTFSVRPGAPVTPVPMPKRASASPPRAQLEEPPTRQFVRPSAPPPSISPVAGPPRSSSRPAPSSRATVNQLAHARSALRPQPVPVISDDRKSDPSINPPATVITARTRVVAARPTISWAAALVTMGVFVGLVTAVVARGDADTLIDAAASFVDPSGSRAAAAGSETMAVHTKAVETHTNVVVTADTLLAPESAASADARVAWEQQSAIPAPPRPAPVAYAAPIHHAAARPAARPAPAAHEERVASAKPAPKADKVEKADKPEKPAKASRANDDDMESASAADALAKAQLEASLR